MFKKAIQRGRSDRDAEAYFLWYVEALREARTKLGAFFNILSFLRAELGKKDHVSDRSLVGKEHDDPIDSDALSGGRRHAVLERAQKILVQGVGLLFARLPPGSLRLEPLALVEGVIQLGERVGDLLSGDVEFEPVGQRRVSILPACERGQLGRVVRNEGRLDQFGFDDFLKGLIELGYQLRILLPCLGILC